MIKKAMLIKKVVFASVIALIGIFMIKQGNKVKAENGIQKIQTEPAPRKFNKFWKKYRRSKK